MKKELIQELLQKFEDASHTLNGIQCWSARELQDVFSYKEWRNFYKVVDKAKQACESAGETVSDHFVDVNKMIELAKGAQREVEDIALTRFPSDQRLRVSFVLCLSCLIARHQVSR